MTRKRFIKLAMSEGIDKRTAEKTRTPYGDSDRGRSFFEKTVQTFT